jgi:hypothetical protein
VLTDGVHQSPNILHGQTDIRKYTLVSKHISNLFYKQNIKFVCRPLRGGYVFGLLFVLEVGSSNVLCNVGELLSKYTALHLKKYYSSHIPLL